MCKTLQRMNGKWNYTLHEYYYIYWVLYPRLESKEISIDSRLATFAHKN